MSDYQSQRPVAWAETLLKVLIWLNWICAVAFAVVLVASFVLADDVVRRGGSGGIPPGSLGAVRIVLAIGLVVVPLAHVALTRLHDIVATVHLGDPFVADNARRLTAIAWAMLGIMMCDLVFGYVAMVIEEHIGWSFSLTGWLAVLLLFVLARVFESGTRMRDEIEGTV